MITPGEVPVQRKITELTLPELDKQITALDVAMGANHQGERIAALYARHALLLRRNAIAPPQLPAVPPDVEAYSLNGGVELPASLGSTAVSGQLELGTAITPSVHPRPTPLAVVV